MASIYLGQIPSASVASSTWDDGDTASLISEDSCRFGTPTRAGFNQEVKSSFVSVSEVEVYKQGIYRSHADTCNPRTLNFKSLFPTLIKLTDNYEEMIQKCRELYKEPASRSMAELRCNYYGNGLCLLDEENWEAVGNGCSLFVAFDSYRNYLNLSFKLRGSNDITTVLVNRESSVDQIKHQKLQELFGNCDSSSLFFNGAELDGGRKIGSCGLPDGSVITVGRSRN